jgi:Spy/CpxP family protein refolding chaperone
MAMARRFGTLLVLSLAAAPTLAAQAPDRRPDGRPDGGSAAQRSPDPQRERLERRFRQGMARVVRERLDLTNAQMVRLQTVNQRHAKERQELFRREREARGAIRRAVLSGDSTAARTVSGLLDEVLSIQQQRLELVRREQQELGDFLSPVQRAKYLELQERLRTRVECAASGERRRARAGGPMER